MKLASSDLRSFPGCGGSLKFSCRADPHGGPKITECTGCSWTRQRRAVLHEVAEAMRRVAGGSTANTSRTVV